MIQSITKYKNNYNFIFPFKNYTNYNKIMNDIKIRTIQTYKTVF